MSKAETLNKELEKYLRILATRKLKIRGCAIVDSDGLIIASRILGSENEMAVGAVTGVLSSLSERIKNEFDSGLFRNAMIETKDLILIFNGIGDSGILTTIAESDADTDKIKPYSKIFSNKINNILTGKVKIQSSEPTKPVKGEKRKPIHRFISKGLILGDYAVGKTSILTRFTQYKFTAEYKQTIGISVVKKEYFLENYNGEYTQVDLVLWDLAAQIRDMAVRHDYYAGADFILVLFDVTRPDTMDSALNWYRDCARTLQQNSGSTNRDPVFLLVGNKIDLPRKVEPAEGKAMAKTMGIPYIETSAKTAQNVEDAFKNVISKFVNQLT
ncbi:MAG: GTP-binding protein [Candidatus Lokiarchaeota archaeon]|nr:GTP-binding protein [Candidatus Lokiarchaeota archaeon]